MPRGSQEDEETQALLGAPLPSPDDASSGTAPVDQPHDDRATHHHHHNYSSDANGYPANSKSTYDPLHGAMSGVSVSVGSKSFFSNERTFLSWMNMAVTLSAISVSVLALGAADATTELYGLLMLPVAVAFCLYALVMFVKRASFLRRRHPGPYDDKVGPVLLTLLLMASIVADMVVAIRHIRSR